MLQLDPNERFRQRRQKARRRHRARRLAAFIVLLLIAATSALGFRFLNGGEAREPAPEGVAATQPQAAAPVQREPRPLPDEMRGIHVTMALMTLRGKLDEYLSYTQKGLNTIQLDVKDENGEVAFRSRYAPLARRIGTARSYYKPGVVARKIHARGVYLVGRVVVFEDPALTRKRPNLAIHRRDGSLWTNYGGLGWANMYDERVWDYNVDIAESAARAGFDEIMFDYVRFPSDGPVEEAVFPGRVAERKGQTISRFLAYARERLKPLGVRVSAAVFGLSATRDLGIGQRPYLLAPHLDAIYPMVYPSHYGSGEHGLTNPNASPGATVLLSLRTFRRALRTSGADTVLIPWLQDFSLGRTYGLADVQAQVESARKVRAGGFLLWNAGGVYTSDALAGR